MPKNKLENAAGMVMAPTKPTIIKNQLRISSNRYRTIFKIKLFIKLFIPIGSEVPVFGDLLNMQI